MYFRLLFFISLFNYYPLFLILVWKTIEQTIIMNNHANVQSLLECDYEFRAIMLQNNFRGSDVQFICAFFCEYNFVIEELMISID